MRQRKELRIRWDKLKRMGGDVEAAVDQFQAAQKTLESAEKILLEAFAKSNPGQSLKLVLDFGQTARVVSGGLAIGSGADTNTNARSAAGFDWVFEYEPRPHVDPKTLNALLSMKLLSDDEKRELLIRHNIIGETS